MIGAMISLVLCINVRNRTSLRYGFALLRTYLAAAASPAWSSIIIALMSAVDGESAPPISLTGTSDGLGR